MSTTCTEDALDQQSARDYSFSRESQSGGEDLHSFLGLAGPFATGEGLN